MVLPPSPTLSLSVQAGSAGALGFPTPQPLMDAVPHPPPASRPAPRTAPTRGGRRGGRSACPPGGDGDPQWPKRMDGGAGGHGARGGGATPCAGRAWQAGSPEPAHLKQGPLPPPPSACLLLPPQDREPTQSTPVQPATRPPPAKRPSSGQGRPRRRQSRRAAARGGLCQDSVRVPARVTVQVAPSSAAAAASAGVGGGAG